MAGPWSAENDPAARGPTSHDARSLHFGDIPQIAVAVRIPVKVISDSGLNVISDSGQSDHRSERSDAGVGL